MDLVHGKESCTVQKIHSSIHCSAHLKKIRSLGFKYVSWGASARKRKQHWKNRGERRKDKRSPFKFFAVVEMGKLFQGHGDMEHYIKGCEKDKKVLQVFRVSPWAWSWVIGNGPQTKPSHIFWMPRADIRRRFNSHNFCIPKEAPRGSVRAGHERGSGSDLLLLHEQEQWILQKGQRVGYLFRVLNYYEQAAEKAFSEGRRLREIVHQSDEEVRLEALWGNRQEQGTGHDQALHYEVVHQWFPHLV